jgi:hypothetical protein
VCGISEHGTLPLVRSIPPVIGGSGKLRLLIGGLGKTAFLICPMEAGEEGGGPVWDGSCDVEMPALTSPGGLIFCRLTQSWHKKNGQSQKKVEILEIIKK